MTWVRVGPDQMVGYVQCRICGAATSMTGTKLCNRCWELETRIALAPDIAEKILAAVRAVGSLPTSKTEQP